MTPEQASLYITVVGIVGTIANLWISLSLKNSVLGVKLWTRENFISKDDAALFLAPLREAMQKVSSESSLRKP